jgi:hypothetical protein
VTSQTATQQLITVEKFTRPTDAQVIAKALLRLTAVFGPSSDGANMSTTLAGEWLETLHALPARATEAAITEWVQTKTYWPKVAHIATITRRIAHADIADSGAKTNLHPDRVAPDPAYAGFRLKISPLRKNERWTEWLDTIHPMHEHSFFVDCAFGGYEHTVTNLSSFAVEQINARWGDSMQKHFGRRIILTPRTR